MLQTLRVQNVRKTKQNAHQMVFTVVLQMILRLFECILMMLINALHCALIQ